MNHHTSNGVGGQDPLGRNTSLRTLNGITYPSVVAFRYALQSAARDLVPSSRTRVCMRYRISKEKPVEVWHSPGNESAHYGNLMTCGSVWHCPVCAAKITERRRIEIQQAVDSHLSSGGFVALDPTKENHVMGCTHNTVHPASLFKSCQSY